MTTTANNARCPRPFCRGPLIEDMDMDGTVFIKCMSCARTFGRVKRNNGSYSETLALMGEAPGLTAQTTLERFEDIESSAKRRGAYDRRSAISLTAQQRREHRRVYNHAYMPKYRQRPEVAAKHRLANREYMRRRRARLKAEKCN